VLFVSKFLQMAWIKIDLMFTKLDLIFSKIDLMFTKIGLMSAKIDSILWAKNRLNVYLNQSKTAQNRLDIKIPTKN